MGHNATVGRIPKGQAKKERVTLTLSPEIAKVLQEASVAMGKPMSTLVETAVEWTVLDGHVAEAFAFALKRRLDAVERAFAGPMSWHAQLKQERGIPDDQQLYPAIVARHRRKVGLDLTPQQAAFSEEDYLAERRQQEEDVQRGIALGRIKDARTVINELDEQGIGFSVNDDPYL